MHLQINIMYFFSKKAALISQIFLLHEERTLCKLPLELPNFISTLIDVSVVSGGVSQSDFCIRLLVATYPPIFSFWMWQRIPMQWIDWISEFLSLQHPCGTKLAYPRWFLIFKIMTWPSLFYPSSLMTFSRATPTFNPLLIFPLWVKVCCSLFSSPLTPTVWFN